MSGHFVLNISQDNRDETIVLKCIECHKEADYVANGMTLCKFHFDRIVAEIEEEKSGIEM